MKYVIKVLLATGGDPMVFEHPSEQGMGHATDGDESRWRDVYCHDDECNWQVSAPAEAFAAVLVLPVVEAVKTVMKEPPA